MAREAPLIEASPAQADTSTKLASLLELTQTQQNALGDHLLKLCAQVDATLKMLEAAQREAAARMDAALKRLEARVATLE